MQIQLETINKTKLHLKIKARISQTQYQVNRIPVLRNLLTTLRILRGFKT